MIEVRGLTKRYGDKVAVDKLTFTVPSGVVTGFLGPNGAGKSTTMRMIAGLDAPSAGSVRVNGQRYRRTLAPMAELGILLEARAVHTSRSAFHHLLALAHTNGIPRQRVEEVIDLVGLRSVAKQRAGAFSLGMGQRLGIASALLGDPQTVVLDEPVNGLDPEGIRWVRELLQNLAAAGRTVFISSHLMSEMALTATRLIVIGRGRLIADTTVKEFVAAASGRTVLVRTPDEAALTALLSGPAVRVHTIEPGRLRIEGLSAEEVGDLAWRNNIRVHELTVQQASLEEAFMELTAGAVQYQASTAQPNGLSTA
jgi:ABC-2 type transport system ATP-binding protein